MKLLDLTALTFDLFALILSVMLCTLGSGSSSTMQPSLSSSEVYLIRDDSCDSANMTRFFDFSAEAILSACDGDYSASVAPRCS